MSSPNGVMIMKRSRNENKELTYNVRVNGRILAAYRHRQMAEDATYTAARVTQCVAELSDQYGDVLLTLKLAKSTQPA